MAERYEPVESSPYWAAFQEWVCSRCLDRRDDGECGLPRTRVCALKRHLPLIVETAHRTHSRDLGVYFAAIELKVCSRCPDQTANGQCVLRDHADCALHSYLSLVLDAIDVVDEAPPPATAPTA